MNLKPNHSELSPIKAVYEYLINKKIQCWIIETQDAAILNIGETELTSSKATVFISSFLNSCFNSSSFLLSVLITSVFGSTVSSYFISKTPFNFVCGSN
ncbi:hypothetical protein [Alkalithermobacter paradoxus]|uniref:hypothetical protein n=1 Tax=Alkalithermobacter paradoxus TaxID=29349 RepID=UPI00117E27DA